MKLGNDLTSHTLSPNPKKGLGKYWQEPLGSGHGSEIIP